jgi:hypothetical protein
MKPLVVLALTFFSLVPACTAQVAHTPTYDEINAKLEPLTDEQLIDCLKLESKTCPLEYRDLLLIEGELGDRKNPDLLIAAYEKSDDDDHRYHLVRALYQIDDPQVLAFMQSIAFEHLGRGPHNEDTYFPLDYLADHCDQRALARLNRHANFKREYPMNCLFWAGTLRSFGRCNYRPSAAHLVRSLDAVCLNITGEAEQGLRKFFPGACQQRFHSIEEEQRCYKKLLKNHPKPE